MVSNWIIIGALTFLGAIVVLYFATDESDAPTTPEGDQSDMSKKRPAKRN